MNRKPMLPTAKGVFSAALALVASTVCLSAQDKSQQPAAITKAVAVIHAASGSGVSGMVTFVKAEDGVRVTGEIKGLTPGKHGFHIHEFGDCSAPDAGSAGPHFNPTNAPHGSPESHMCHAGDLGNITADSSGVATIDLTSKEFDLDSPASIIGRSVIVHAKEDDLKSQPSGESGARLGCGVVGIAKP